MKTLSTLLVPTDFSELSLEALDLALELSPGATIHLLFVADAEDWQETNADFAPTPKGYRESVEAFHQKLRGAAQHKFEEVQQRYPISNLVTETRFGDAAENIIAEATRIRADAIVMATHAREGWAHLRWGSITEAVLRHATCPVVTTHHDAAADG